MDVSTKDLSKDTCKMDWQDNEAPCDFPVSQGECEAIMASLDIEGLIKQAYENNTMISATVKPEIGNTSSKLPSTMASVSYRNQDMPQTRSNPSNPAFVSSQAMSRFVFTSPQCQAMHRSGAVVPSQHHATPRTVFPSPHPRANASTMDFVSSQATPSSVTASFQTAQTATIFPQFGRPTVNANQSNLLVNANLRLQQHQPEHETSNNAVGIIGTDSRNSEERVLESLKFQKGTPPPNLHIPPIFSYDIRGFLVPNIEISHAERKINHKFSRCLIALNQYAIEFLPKLGIRFPMLNIGTDIWWDLQQRFKNMLGDDKQARFPFPSAPNKAIWISVTEDDTWRYSIYDPKERKGASYQRLCRTPGCCQLSFPNFKRMYRVYCSTCTVGFEKAERNFRHCNPY